MQRRQLSAPAAGSVSRNPSLASVSQAGTSHPQIISSSAAAARQPSASSQKEESGAHIIVAGGLGISVSGMIRNAAVICRLF